MTPAESLLAWDRARVFTQGALDSLMEAPVTRTHGGNSSEHCIEGCFEIIEANLKSALKEMKKLRGPK